MPSKLIELMNRVRVTIQVEVSLGYEKAVASTRKISDAIRQAVRRTEDADRAGRRMLGAGESGAQGTGPLDAVVEVHRPAFNRRYSNTKKIEYRPSELPVFAGPPTREQVRQGQIGDCGLIAVIGAVGKHRPEAIQRAIRERSDGTFDITFHNIEHINDGTTLRPTGKTTTFRVSNELPHARNGPPGPPIGARSDSCSWPSLLEKAAAGEDRAWDPVRHSIWDLRWRGLKPGVDSARRRKGLLLSSPSTPPLGYNRIGVGSSPAEQANLLARITGEEAVVRDLPPGHRDLLSEVKGQLDSNKPVIVASRTTVEGANYPDGVYANHAYGVERVVGDKIELRNPWGYDHPEPMSAGTFLKLYHPVYTTLS